MIKSIQFTGKGNDDYLMLRNYQRVLKDGVTKEDYKELKKKLGANRAINQCYEEKDVGLLNDRANLCLIGKEIKFERDRINLIFGPNACGKSTILKAIAGYALCGSNGNKDGFTNPFKYQPSDFPLFKEKTNDELSDLIYKDMGNDAKIEWDGNPVYYHNFSERIHTGSIDDYVGSIFGDIGDALSYELNKGKMSGGKQSIAIFAQLFNIVNSKYQIKDIADEYLNKHKHSNDTWQKALQLNIDYLNKFGLENNDHITLLLDEVDKSLDINNVNYMFKNLIPELHNVNNDQIIVISHSPLVLSEDVCSSEKYNLISLMPEYTEYVINLFKNIKY